MITEAGVHDKVVGLVHVSALSPDANETTSQQYHGFTTPPEFVIGTTADGYGSLDRSTFKAGFAHDTSDAYAAFPAAFQVPIPMAAFATPLQHAAWRGKQSWAVIAREDKAFDQRMLEHTAQRIGAEVTRVSASHAVFMTQPLAVADV